MALPSLPLVVVIIVTVTAILRGNMDFEPREMTCVKVDNQRDGRGREEGDDLCGVGDDGVGHVFLTGDGDGSFFSLQASLRGAGCWDLVGTRWCPWTVPQSNLGAQVSRRLIAGVWGTFRIYRGR